jgi:hypothetical protein
MRPAQLRQLIARRRRKLPPAPQGDPNGTWLPDHERKTEVFVPFDELQYMCKDMMNPANAAFAEDMGKVHFSKDPTYNLRRKRDGNKV